MAWLQGGDCLRETLEVERLLGEGAFAEGYRIRDRLLRCRLAPKLARSAASLETAADFREQAIVCKPELRQKYERRLTQCRPGDWM